MKTLWTFLLSAFLLFSLAPAESLAMMHGKGSHVGPYGGYCRGPRWGWYGAGRQVKTVEEVRELVSEFLAQEDLVPGEIRDLGTHFEVEVRDAAGEVVDLLIVDKKTCRMRSAY